jgi:hypothetical protein
MREEEKEHEKAGFEKDGECRNERIKRSSIFCLSCGLLGCWCLVDMSHDIQAITRHHDQLNEVTIV